MQGAVIGQLVGTGMSLWISIGSLTRGTGSHGNKPLPLSTENCPIATNTSASTNIRSTFEFEMPRSTVAYSTEISPDIESRY